MPEKLMTIASIEPYNAAWKAEFERLKLFIDSLLSDFDINVQHVGSTSIPGLVAKPILDIDIIIRDKKELSAIGALLEGVGYLSKGDQGIAGRFAYSQAGKYTPDSHEKSRWQEHHLYVCIADSLALKNHLAFRNALLNDACLVERYADLKKKLFGEGSITRELYWRKKTDFILSVLQSAGLNEQELDEIGRANR